MEQTCRAWLLAIRQSDMELWKGRMLSRFPRMRMLLPILESRQTLLYRVLYRNQLEAECFESTANDANMDDYVVTVELLYGGEVREVSCGRFRDTTQNYVPDPLDTAYSWFEIGRLWDTQPQWFSRWLVDDLLGRGTVLPATERLRIRVFATLGNHTLKLYENCDLDFADDIEFGEVALSPFADDFLTMDVTLSTNGLDPLISADGNVHYDADEIQKDTGMVRLLIRSRGSSPFNVDPPSIVMTQYLAALPWPKHARGV